MMMRTLRLTVPILAVLAVAPTAARAQYGYPAGYGGYGWGGWGGGGGGTVQGDVARGLGTLAAGAGTYNVQTAQAAAINANTAANINQYMYLSQMETNRRYREKMIRQKKLVNETADTLYKRLHDNPTSSDVYSGDAPNVVLDELNSPKVYVRGLAGAKNKVPGTLIRDIPFQHASSAITVSVEELTKAGAPASIKENPAFDADRAALRKTVAELRAEQEEKGEYNPATLQKIQGQIETLWTKVRNTLPKNSKGRVEAEKFLKAAYGLSKMLETPAVAVLLAGVEKHPEATVGDLLMFMKSYNFRFGVAKTARQKVVYDELYPVLVKLRDEALPQGAGDLAAGSPQQKVGAPGEFFQGMEFKGLSGDKVPAPPAPAQPK